MPSDNLDFQIILKLGAEGGTITLYGKENNGKWYFFLNTNESTLLDFVDDEELFQNLIRNSSIVEGLENGLSLLDEYPWEHLSPHKLHPLFADELILEVKKRRPNDNVRRWERAYKISKLRH
jgi:hypothetical protein